MSTAKDGINIEIGDKKYFVEVAKTNEEQSLGLMGRKSLSNDEGMLFIFELPLTAKFWMKNTLIPLDIVFINEDLEVISVKLGKPETTDFITENNVLYVLEVNQNSGIKPGDELDFEDNTNTPIMKVLAPDGSTQMELQGGERIFSRKSTKRIIKWAKKAFDSKSNQELYENYCKRLGKCVLKELKAQDDRKPEYVEAPKEK